MRTQAIRSLRVGAAGRVPSRPSPGEDDARPMLLGTKSINIEMRSYTRRRRTGCMDTMENLEVGLRLWWLILEYFV